MQQYKILLTPYVMLYKDEEQIESFETQKIMECRV